MNALSNITILPSTKAEIKSFVEKAKTEILSGNYNPLEITIRLKAVEDMISEIRKDKEVKESVLREAAKYGSLPFEFQGAKIEFAKLGVKYDFSQCHDSEWDELEAQSSEIDKKKKEREIFLKSIPDSGAVNPITGELISQPKKTYEDGIKIFLL